MTAGKAASQAGHAFLESYETAPPDIVRAYRADGGTKVVLSVADDVELRRLYDLARHHHLPCALVVESNHVMPPVFDGSPIITAVGIGPVDRVRAKIVTKGLKLM